MSAVLKLYEIADELEAIHDALIDAEGVLDDDLEARLDAAEGMLYEKADRIAMLIRNNKASAEALRAEGARFYALAKSRERAAESLSGYLVRQMKRIGRDVLDTTRFRLSVRSASKPTIEHDGVSRIPKALQRIKVELDKTKALELLKSGKRLPKGITHHTTESLNIR